MRFRTFLCSALMVLFGASLLVAQGTQIGLLRGTVTTSDKLSVPGATVVVKSPALQGERTTTTGTDGAFLFRVPAGEYTVSVSMSGMKTVEKKATVPLGGVADLDVMLEIAPLAEAIEVKGVMPTILATPTVGANILHSEIAALATRRDLEGVAQLSPGVTENTPNAGQLAINGAFAYDNVFMINGIDVNDNLFGSPQNLFIEDAIQETQVLTSGISAEYGRFSGGVVNAITKSGGNIFSGSFRTNFSNPTWSTLTPFDVSKGVKRTTDISESYEGTFGGPIRKDMIWFFGAGRFAKTNTQNTLQQTGVQYTQSDDNRRGELKGTVTPWRNQTFQVNYINNSRTQDNRPSFSFSIDPAVLANRKLPNYIVGGSWRGVLRSNLYAEAQVSQRKFGFSGDGGSSKDIIDSPIISLSEGLHYNAPYFDATDPENRNNRQVTASLSYSMAKFGHHDFKGGYEWFQSQRTGGNSQSSTDFVFDADYATTDTGAPLLDANGRLIPVFSPGDTLIEHWIAQRGAELNVNTNSLYIQDHWTATTQLSFDLGVRYEQVRSKATGGIIGVDTNTLVPRLAMAYAPGGSGRTVFHVTYGHYSGRYDEAQIGANNNVGNPDATFGVYDGPAGQGRDFAAGFDPANYTIVSGTFPTANVFFKPNLSAPITKEFTVSGGTELGSKGSAQATYVWRRTNNFIEDFIDITNGVVDVNQNGTDFGTFTKVVYANTDVPKRDYQGVVLQARYNLMHNWTVAGNWTIQIRNDGTFEGEATNQPALTSVFGDYVGANGIPGIYSPDRSFPDGRLQDFQRHRARVWTVYTRGLGRYGNMSASALVRADSGTVFSLRATRVPLTAIQQQLIDQLGYPDSPSSQTVYFGQRGSQTFAGYALLDTSVNYDIPVFKSARPWVKLDVYNLLNNQKLITWNTVVRPDPNSPLDSLGLPTGFVQGSQFGTATAATNFPLAFPGQTGGRTFRVAVGFRF